ncbi:MAG: ABC transporter permease [Pseudomonadota bacterium]
MPEVGGRRLEPGAWLGLGLVASIALVSLGAPWLAPHDPLALHTAPSLCPPSSACWLGADVFGRDQLSRLIWGGRVSFAIGGLSMGIALTLGCALGALAGYLGGWVDRGVAALADLFLALPRLVLVLAVIGLLRVTGGASLIAVVVVLGLTGWMSMARMVRAQLQGLREGSLARACRALGLPTWRILLVHLLPQALPAVLVHATLGLGRVVLIEASLSFLGLGVPQPVASWGSSIALGRAWLPGAWWLVCFPTLAVLALVVGLELLGGGLREAFAGGEPSGAEVSPGSAPSG